MLQGNTSEMNLHGINMYDITTGCLGNAAWVGLIGMDCISRTIEALKKPVVRNPARTEPAGGCLGRWGPETLAGPHVQV